MIRQLLETEVVFYLNLLCNCSIIFILQFLSEGKIVLSVSGGMSMETKKIFIGSAKPGMKLAADVYDSDSRLIVPKDIIIDESVINRFKLYSVFSLIIYLEEEKQELKPEEVGYFESIKQKKDFAHFEEKFSESVDDLKTNLNDIVKKYTPISPEKMLKGVAEVIASNKTGHNMFDMLNCMRGYDDLTYVHSMNVALICNVMAGWLGKSQEETDLITMAGLLHDIGKLKMPVDIITKPEKLTDEEYEIIKSHPTLGHDILLESNVDERIKNAAWMHHERYDGGGYPNGLVGEQIDDIARIVAIADVYDAMTANRVYRNGLCPFKVIAHFERDMSIYDPRYILLFLEKTAETYVSNKVLLSNGKEGKIIMINKMSLSQPVVMVGDKIYDLAKQKDITIEQLL